MWTVGLSLFACYFAADCVVWAVISHGGDWARVGPGFYVL